jgi:DNA polymerase-1
MSTALIDADVIVYRALYPATSEVDWDGAGTTPLNNLPAAKTVADNLIAEWAKKAGCKQLHLVFTDRTKAKASFRHHVHPYYKANRTGPKPAMHDDIFEYLHKYPNSYLKDMEGDDLMGLMGTHTNKYTLVTVDKDMDTLPARVFNPDKDKKPRKISLREANYNWMYQTIVGDAVDNFKGAPGAGPKAAERALAGITNFGELVNAAVGVFVTQLDKEKTRDKFVNKMDAFSEFLMNARCARILRTGDYDKANHKVKLWHPDPAKQSWINPYVKIDERRMDVV